MPTSSEGSPPRELIAVNAKAIASMRARAEESIDRHQRLVERVTASLGRPAALYVVLACVAVWIAVNLGLMATGRAPIDAPPFFWLQGCVTLGALLTALMVLTTQNRQKRHGEERAQLDLQINLAAEQKTAKMIALLEELRRDLPNVPDRRDTLAEAMTRAVDPHAAVAALQRTFEDDEQAATPAPPDPARGSAG